MEEHDRNQRTGHVAQALGLSPASIQAYARTGRIPFRLTPGRQYRFNVEEVRAILSPEPVTTAQLGSIFTADAPMVDALTAYRPDPIDAAVERRLRTRAARNPATTRRAAQDPSQGREQLAALLRSATGAAAAVVHRHPANA